MLPIYCHKVKNVVVIKYSLPVQFVSSLCTFSLGKLLDTLVSHTWNIDRFRKQTLCCSVFYYLFLNKKMLWPVNMSLIFKYSQILFCSIISLQKNEKIMALSGGFLSLSGSLYPQKTQQLFISGNLPFSSWPKLKARCEYAFINLTSHSKRSESGGSGRINLNRAFISLT